jgi:hypothetical protein
LTLVCSKPGLFRDVKCLSAAEKGNFVPNQGNFATNKGLVEAKLLNVVVKRHCFVPTKGNVVTNKGLFASNQGYFATKLIKCEPDQIKSSLNSSHLRNLTNFKTAPVGKDRLDAPSMRTIEVGLSIFKQTGL